MAMSDDLDDVDDAAESGASADMATSVLIVTTVALAIAIWVIGSVGADRYGLEFMGIAAVAPRVGGEAGKVLAIVTPDAGPAEPGSRPEEIANALPEYLSGSSYVMVSLGSEQGTRVGDRLKIGAQFPDGSTDDYIAEVFIVGPNFCHAVCAKEIKKMDENSFAGWSVKRETTSLESAVVNRIFPPQK